ncbi:hypothetical protein Patl1_03604 [Pistacia atlantica]|uniref:Uncharacterized protein n=1 Tax=Pistacia atlantica TaxID=434234 RepID=A0ACC1CD20_9ROSI|nr:hypothetical protein Patl1_03604 [Pistacia atlantica]
MVRILSLIVQGLIMEAFEDLENTLLIPRRSTLFNFPSCLYSCRLSHVFF